MLTTRLLMSGLIAFGLALAPTGVIAAEPHAHTATVAIKLDNGRKWPTDEAEAEPRGCRDRSGGSTPRHGVRRMNSLRLVKTSPRFNHMVIRIKPDGHARTVTVNSCFSEKTYGPFALGESRC